MHSPAPETRSRRRGLRGLAALALTAVAGLAIGTAAPLAASAAELDAITGVEIVTESPSDPIHVWQRYQVKATWAAPAGATAGDTFSLSFPSPVNAYAASFELKDRNGVVVGSCDVTGSRFDCTLNDYVDTHDNVHGTLFFYAQSSEATEEGEYVFETGNGVRIPVGIPGGGVVEGEPGSAPTSPQKWGWLNGDGRSLTWVVMIPSEFLTPVGGQDLVMTDVYDERLTFDSSTLRASWILKSEWNTGSATAVPAGTGAGSYTLVDRPSDNAFDLTFNEPVSDGSRIYQFQYRTNLPADVAQGDLFGNTVTASGVDFHSWPVEYVTAGGEGGGYGKTGGFTVTKSLSGTGAGLVPEDARFTVDYAYTAKGADVTGSLEITAGETQGLSGLPTGTVVTLSEAAPAAVPGIDYGPPVFGGEGVTVADGTASITIGDATTVVVTLENPAIRSVGAFSVTKTLSGPAAGLVPADALFTVEYAYSVDGEDVTGALEIGAGQTDGLTGLPEGTVVTLQEKRPELVEGAAYGAPLFSGDGVTVEGEAAVIVIGDGTVVEVALENPVAPAGVSGAGEEAVETPTTPAPAADLAHTGVDATIGALTVAGLLLAGAGLLIATRRRARA